MEIQHLQQLISQGENQRTEFKSEQAVPASIAKEMTAFSNTHGGMLLIGVEDDGSVTGIQRTDVEEWIANIARNNITPAINPSVKILEIQGRKIAVVEIEKGVHKPYQTIDGKYWLRVGSTNRTATKEEFSRLFQQAGLVHFDISPVPQSSIRDLDPAKLNDYWQTYYQIAYFDLDETERLRLLTNADILVELEGETVASVGGLLIFGVHPQRRLPQASIVFAVFKGKDLTDDIVDKKEVGGTLPEQIENTAALIKLFSPASSTIEELKRKDNGAYPSESIREALVNAVAHRDYSISNQKITVYLFEDRLEITSPGALSNTLTLEKIKYGNSAPRNLFLVKYLDNMRYIDGLGRGVPRMIRQLGSKVTLEEIGVLFKVTIKRS